MASARPAGLRGAREDPPLDLLRHLSLSRTLGPITQGQSRFLGHRAAGALEPARPGSRTPASTLRAQAVLSRLESLEGRLRGRRAPPSAPSTPSSSSSQSSSTACGSTESPRSARLGPPQGQPGRRFLKNRSPSTKAAPAVALQGAARPSRAPPAPGGSPDSHEEGGRDVLGGLPESSRTKEAPGTGLSSWSPAEPKAHPWGDVQPPSPAVPASLPTLGSGTRTPHATLGSGTRTPHATLGSGTRTPHATLGSGTRTPHAPREETSAPSSASLSDPVPFSGAETPQDSVAEPLDMSLAEGSEDSHDFHVHILSPSDLHPSSPQGTAGSEAVLAASDPPSDSEVSEQLGEGSSSSGSPTARTPSWAYSEDFEVSETPSNSMAASQSKATLSLEPTRPVATHVPRVVLKETAVQTPEPAFTYQWLPEAGMAAMGPSLGGAYVDPVPIASHVVSPDAIEALTAYSPAALALNDLLRQQLSLTQRFADASRELHGALLRALGPPAFRYHTLEETREYIRRHRPTRLSMEAALEEVKLELEAPGAWV